MTRTQNNHYASIHILVLAFAVLLLSSCMSASRIDTAISNKFYGKIPERKTFPDSSQVQVKSAVTYEPTESISITKRTKSRGLILLLYNHWNQVFETQLNPDLTFNNIANSIQIIAQSKVVTDKLAGRTLEIVVDSIPNRFIYTIKERDLFFSTIMLWGLIESAPQDLVIHYTIKDPNGGQSKQGKLIVNILQTKLVTLVYHNPDTFILEFYSKYENKVKSLGAEIMTKIFSNL